MPRERLAWLLLHPATFLFVSTALLVVAGNALWHQNREHLALPSSQVVPAERVVVNEPGEWLTEGLDRQVSESIGAMKQRLDDPDAVEKVAELVRQVPAIEAVKQIRKTAAGISIEAAWRRPAAAIRMPEGHYRLLDRHGVVLDRQATSEEQADQFLRLSLLRPGGENLRDWQVWSDVRVVSAAAIAGEIEPAWRELGLYRVVTFRYPEAVAPPDGSFELWTAKGAKVIWSDTGATADPDLVQRRIDAIRAWIRANGPLDSLIAKRMMLDVRSGNSKLIPDQRSAGLPTGSEDGIF